MVKLALHRTKTTHLPVQLGVTIVSRRAWISPWRLEVLVLKLTQLFTSWYSRESLGYETLCSVS